MSKNALVDFAQFRPGLGASGSQRSTAPVELVEGIRLPARLEQQQDQLPPQILAQRMPRENTA
nr:hypothetical protein [Streptomyces durbertensis]